MVIHGDRRPLGAQSVDSIRYSDTKGFLGNVKRLTQWGVVYQRNFHPIHGPITRAKPRADNFLDESLYSSVVHNGDQFLVVILPDGYEYSTTTKASEIKPKFSKCKI